VASKRAGYLANVYLSDGVLKQVQHDLGFNCKNHLILKSSKSWFIQTKKSRQFLTRISHMS